MSRKNRHVLHVSTVPQTFLRLFPGLIAAQRGRDWEVDLACSPGTWVAAEEVGRRLGVTIHQVRLSRQVQPLTDLVALLQLVRLIVRLRPVVVHAHTPKAGLLATVAAWLTRRPARVYTVRGAAYLTAIGFQRRLLLWSERVACACAHGVVFVSRSLHDEFITRRLCHPSKAQVIRSGSGQGVDSLGRFNPERVAESASDVKQELGLDEGAVVFGFIGRLVVDKGFHELAHCWNAISDTHQSTHLIIAGPRGEPRGAVPNHLLQRLISHPRVHHVGNVDNIEAYYAVMDILLFPSHREGFPNAVLEASAMGIPTIAFDVVGSRDAVLDGVTGCVVPCCDADLLLERATQLCEDHVLRKTMGEAARAWVHREFRPEPIFQDVVSLYEELLAE